MTLLEQLLAARRERATELENLLAPIVTAKRAASTDEEASIEAATGIITQLDARIADLIKQEESRKASEAAFDTLGLGAVKVKSEPRVYDKYSGNSYFRDLWSKTKGAPGASDRLDRHSREVETIAKENRNSIEARALSTTDGAGGFVKVAAA